MISPTAPGHRGHRLVVGLDGSSADKATLAYALAAGAWLVEEVRDEERSAAGLGPAPVAVHVQVTARHPAQAFVEASGDADLLVVGSHGPGIGRRIPAAPGGAGRSVGPCSSPVSWCWRCSSAR